jgi:hypothetical protein
MLALAVRAQSPQKCGIVGIDGPSQLDPGSPLVLKARITGTIHTTKPEFKWTVSVGTITTGQGTDEITVDTVGLGGQEVTATVELLGAPESAASQTTRVNLPGIVCGLAFDQYGDIKFEDEKVRLDNFAIQLMNQPQSSGSIMMSAGQETFENETTERLSRAKAYLVDVREIDPNRIVIVDCGFSQDLSIHLYVVPLGATFPQCSNSDEVPFSKVRFTKRRPPPPKKRR